MVATKPDVREKLILFFVQSHALLLSDLTVHVCAGVPKSAVSNKFIVNTKINKVLEKCQEHEIYQKLQFKDSQILKIRN